MICRIRRSSPPEASSASRSKSGGTCQSIRKVESGQGWIEHLPAGVPRRVEVEPPLGRPAGQVGADVADQELVVERLPVEASAPSSAAQTSPRGAGAGHGVGAGLTRRPSAQVTVTPVVVLVEAGDLVAPAHVDQRLGGDALRRGAPRCGPGRC